MKKNIFFESLSTTQLRKLKGGTSNRHGVGTSEGTPTGKDTGADSDEEDDGDGV